MRRLRTLLGILLLILIAPWLAWRAIPPLDPLPPAPYGVGRTTRILDREGRLLYSVGPEGEQVLPVPLEEVSPFCRQATLAAEDARFYRHPGVDPLAVLRAAWQNWRAGQVVSGGSTLTQQVVRLYLFPPQERLRRTWERKLREAWLALRLERRYGKDQILALYLNGAYYGRQATGIEAAARAYFGRSARDLGWAECIFLAGLPQAPSRLDPVRNPEGARARFLQVRERLVQEGILTAQEAREIPFPEVLPAPRRAVEAPHFVFWVLEELRARFGEEALREGLEVRTSLDRELQRRAQELVRRHVDRIRDRYGATNAALVALDPATGEIRVLVGSADYWDDGIDGKVNVVLSPRQPGSAIKPLIYLAAFRAGWTPATLVWDLPFTFRDRQGRPYRPQNYDLRFHGPMRVRTALANSYNVPAVYTLDRIGVEAAVELGLRMGLESWRGREHDLALALGGAEVTPLELAGLYAVLARGGTYLPPVAILEVRDGESRLLYRYDPPLPQPVLGPDGPRLTYLITDILKDEEARRPTFGAYSPLWLEGWEAAAKTGTTTDWRDAWTAGYTANLVAVVWVGNSDGRPMEGLSGSLGAAPLWHDFMVAALAGERPRPFPRPEGVEEVWVCPVSGYLATPACPGRVRERVPKGREPTRPCPLHAFYPLLPDGRRAPPDCPQARLQALEVWPSEYQPFARLLGRGLLPPSGPCPTGGADLP